MSSEIDQLLRESLQEVDRLRRSLKKHQELSSEPIAITAMACRTPGGVETPEEFWELLHEGRDAIGPLPERWYTQTEGRAGSLAQVEGFDALFFGISPREAIAMDPQQRLLLEVAWEALERSGAPPAELAGTSTGVYVGSQGSHYGWWNNSGESAGHRVTGLAGSVLAGRIAYALDLHGPAVTIDTACSSSLVAIHLACNALRQGECELALAGGVYVLTAPGALVEFGHLSGLAPDGRCKAFSEAADGTSWSEGVGLLVLKKLSQASRHGDKILAVISGSAVNQDGRSQGLTAPNGILQQRVIQRALRASQLKPQDIDAIEAHGTGTKLGDPIEASALAEVFASGKEQRPLWLGSSKSNFGHAQSAAGVLGLIKMVLALQQRCLPPTLHAALPNQHIDWDASRLTLLQTPQAWPADPKRRRRAGVSAFGISGTNAHVILSESESHSETSQAERPGSTLPLLLSGRSLPALESYCGRLAAQLRCGPEVALQDLAFSLATTRTAFPVRLSITATPGDRPALVKSLLEIAKTGEPPAGAWLTPQGHRTGKLVLLFSGHGSHYEGMGEQLYGQPGLDVFSKTLDEVLSACQLDLKLFGSDLQQTQNAQPALFALETALYRQYQAWGIKADILLGHSLGELVVAHVSGIIDLRDAATLVCARGRLMAELAKPGGSMAALQASAEEVQAALSKLPKKLRNEVTIAALNSEQETVISGDPKGVERLLKQFKKKKRKTKKLGVSHAFHSPHMDSVLEAFGEIAEQVQYGTPSGATVLSSLTGEFIDLEANDMACAEYWVRQLREPVRFAPAASLALADGANTFLECGPGVTLSSMVGQLAQTETALVPSLRQNSSEVSNVMSAVGAVQVRGHELDWQAFYRPLEAARVKLPTYAFQRQRYWLDFDLGHAPSQGEGQTLSHPFLDSAIRLPDQNWLVNGQVNLQRHAWLNDHVVHGTVLVPGTAVLEICFQVAHLVGAEWVEELLMLTPIALSGEAPSRQLQLYVRCDSKQNYHLQIRSRVVLESDWVTHAKATLVNRSAVVEPAWPGSWPPEAAAPIAFDEQSHLQRLQGTGFDFGPMFQGLRAAWEDPNEANTVWVEIALAESSLDDGFHIHPALLDALFQCPFLLPGELASFVPFELSGLRVWENPRTSLRARFQRLTGDDQGFTARASVWDTSGRPVAHLGKLRFQIASPEKIQAAAPRTGRTSILAWQARPLDPNLSPRPTQWTSLSEADSTQTRLALDLRDHQLSAEELNIRLLGLLQRFLSQEQADSITLLTRAAALEEVEDVAGAAAWGLLRTLRLERPELNIQLLDSDGHPESEALLREGTPSERQLEAVLREGSWHRLELQETAPDSSEPLALPGTVLLSGGSGGLGQAVAQHLVEKHRVRHLLILSRRGSRNGRAQEFKKRLKALGAESVTQVRCDVSDSKALSAVLKKIPQKAPLSAVFHLAGVLQDATFPNQTAENLREVFAPKLQGALNLDELTRESKALSRFVLFSSLAAETGSAGQANYAAANAGLQAVASRRRRLGYPAHSIAWGPWKDAGMAASLASSEQTRLVRSGLGSLPTSVGLQLLDSILASEGSNVSALYTQERPTASLDTPAPRTPRPLRLSPDEQFKELQKLVRVEAARVLGLAGPEQVPIDRPLRELGLDSLMAVDLRNRLMAKLGRKLPATLAFDYPNPEGLARYLAANEAGPLPEPAATALPVAGDSVAIIGMACRTPGGALDPEAYWELLAEGKDAIGPFPQRWSFNLSDADQGLGGFLHDVDLFDPLFFGISPREALSMDPQQRLVLEAVWESLERSGICPEQLSESNTGVYMGSTGSGYGLDSPLALDGYRLTGIDTSLLSGRVSYILGLQGPALTVNTACSSSLVAIHLACKALASGECDLALAGGVQIMASAVGFVESQRLGVLASDGRCKAFSAEADGTTWAEGLGVVVLKRSSDAQRDGNTLLAQITGTAINQDGRSQGLTAPNGPSQQRVIRKALASAGLQPEDIDAVEAHGTGTSLGDPIEAEALANVFGPERRGQAVWLGSSKSNLGHTQSAAGVLGMMKMVLALKHHYLPGTLHASHPTEHIDWKSSGLRLLQEGQPWPTSETRVRRAGVSSFGLSGTNAHLILEQAPPTAEPAPLTSTPEILPLLLSAKTREALRANARTLAHALRSKLPTVSYSDLAFSLATTRTAFRHRLALPLTVSEAESFLRSFGEQELEAIPLPPGAQLWSAAERPAKLAVMFSGQGSQRLGMGLELHGQPGLEVFTKSLETAMAACDQHLERSLREVLEVPSSQALSQTQYTQPALFALEIALFRQWQAWGLQPDFLLGHSVGELAAAQVAGILTLSDAAKLVCARGRMMSELATPGGAMASLQATEQEVHDSLEKLKAPAVTVAAVNGRNQVTVSGDPQQVDDLVDLFQNQGRRAKKLDTSHAFHSPHMEKVLEPFAQTASQVCFGSAELPVISTLTGRIADLQEGDLVSADYWVRQLRQTVRFAQAVETATKAGVQTFLECGPDGSLAGLVEDGIPTLHRSEGETFALMSAVGALHVRGYTLDWSAFFKPFNPRRVSLPTYAFQRDRYWLESAPSQNKVAGTSAFGHPILQSVCELPNGGCLFTGQFDLERQPWLAEHVVHNTIIVPGTTLLELILQAALSRGAGYVDELLFLAPIALSQQTPRRNIQLHLSQQKQTWEAQLRTQPDEGDSTSEWTLHATAEFSGGDSSRKSLPSLTSWPPAGAENLALEPGELYQAFSTAGLSYGPAFRGLRGAWRDRDGKTVWVESSLPLEHSPFPLHPALLESVFQAQVLETPQEELSLPFRFSKIQVRELNGLTLRARLKSNSEENAITLWNGQGQPVLEIGDLDSRQTTAAQVRSALAQDPRSLLFSVRRIPTELDSTNAEPKSPGWTTLAQQPAQVSYYYLDLRDHGLDSQTLCQRLLAQTQEWLKQHRFEGLTVLTKGAQGFGASSPLSDIAGAAALGLLRVLNRERPELKIRLIDIDEHPDSRELLNRILPLQSGSETVLRQGGHYELSLKPLTSLPSVEAPLALPDSPNYTLEKSATGSLEELHLSGGPRQDLGAKEVRVEVRAAGLNFRDLLNALGMYPDPDQAVGGEFAGVVCEVGKQVTNLHLGDPVMGLASKSFSQSVVADPQLLVPIPASLSFAQAATIPVAFLTAYYALVDLANLQKGERILIHAASGGIGMAALQLATHLGAEVFATASPGKWERVPLAQSRLSNSRELSFEAEILERTQGQGVDVVLNALTGEFVDASLRLLRPGGRFLEMGKRDLREPSQVAQDYQEVAYVSFDMAQAGPERIQQLLLEITGLLEEGRLKPLPLKAFDIRLARDAFRFMAQTKHVGKLVLTPPPPKLSTAITAQSGTVLITGGTGALGRLLARHLVRHHEVKNLTLLSRSGDKAEGASQFVQELQDLGARCVILKACDVRDRESIRETILSIPKQHPLTAVFHLSGVLRDSTFPGLTATSLAEVLEPKLESAIHLSELSEQLKSVTHFVLFSSVAGVIGAAGQGNYAAASAGLDALALQRRGRGLPALSIDWGPWENLGMTAAAPKIRHKKSSHLSLSPSEGLELLDFALETSHAQLAAQRLAEPDRAQRSTPSQPEPGQREAWIEKLVRAEAARVLGLANWERVPLDRPLQELGLDSLTAVELRNRLMTQLELRLPATLAFDYPEAQSIAAFLIDESSTDDEPTLRNESDDLGEALAVVAMACRAPGGVTTPESYWRLLAEGRDAIGPWPARWQNDSQGANLEIDGQSYLSEGGFLENAEEFDAGFFGISPREARAMDPQQRITLEVVWETLERAGIDPTTLRESSTGVYLGSQGSDYGWWESSEDLAGYKGTGTASGVLSGRVSYVLDLQGPAITVNTACSSSLVALHLACYGLKTGDCDLALAGGVQVMSTPITFLEMGRLGGLASDGRCKAFSAQADGAGWSEGAGILLLKRLSDATRDGDRVLSVIRGSALNQDGRSQGLTAPNGPSQQRVVAKALAASQLNPDAIDAVEAHGTGTSLGDPIEAGALARVFGQDRERPLWLGSSKSNLGHTQAAAGVLGVIKMVLALENERLPQTIHSHLPSPHIDWEDSGLRLLQESQLWPRSSTRIRRAGVSSFGISGTNAHLILEEGARPRSETLTAEVKGLPLLLSGHSTEALREQAGRWRDWLMDHRESWPAFRSTAARRAQLEVRGCLWVDSVEQAEKALDALAKGHSDSAVQLGRGRSGRGLVFVFPGQGSQWPAMGRELLEESPIFAQEVEACDKAFRAHIDWSVTAVLSGAEGAPPLEAVEVVQPTLFTIAVALAAVWRGFGCEPVAVLGHSQGEIAAAVVAGHLSLEQGAQIVSTRCRLLGGLNKEGGMLAVELPLVEANKRLQALPELSVAVVNTETSTVISGSLDQLQKLHTELQDEGVFCHQVEVDYASHSSHVDGVLTELRDNLRGLRPKRGDIPLISTVTGSQLHGPELDAGYWCRNLREPVRLDLALECLEADQISAFVEISPHPLLSLPLAENARTVVGSLRRDSGGLSSLYRSLAQLHLGGLEIGWEKLLTGPCLPTLPTYPFQRKRYWLDSKPGTSASGSDGASSFWNAVAKVDSEAVAGLLQMPETHRRDLERLLPYLRDWHQRDLATRAVQGWRYEECWKAAAGQADKSDRFERCWIVSEGAEGKWLAGELRGNCEVTILGLKEAVSRLSASLPPMSLIYLPDSHLNWDEVMSQALTLTQAVCENSSFQGRLWFVTPQSLGLHPKEHPKTASLQTLWGFGRALSLEKPVIFGGSLDLPSVKPERSSGLKQALGTVLQTVPQGDEFAVRGGRLWERRLVRVGKRDSEPWAPDGQVLITGGTGYLGGCLAHWLVKAGVANIVLLSRSGLQAEGALDLKASLEAKGCEVSVVSCDLLEPSRVEATLKELPDLQHIFHLGGTGSATPLESLTKEILYNEMAAKFEGAWNLHRATQKQSLKSFVCYGSIAGLWGSGGQLSYSAANAGLHGLVQHRRGQGLPAQLIHWGRWPVGGIVDDQATKYLQRRGILEMQADLALHALGLTLAEDKASTAIVNLDWPPFVLSLSSARRRFLFDDIAEARCALQDGLQDQKMLSSPFLSDLFVRPEAERYPWALQVVRTEVALVLGLDSAQAVPEGQAIQELGLDSLMAVELRKRLAERTQMELPTTLVFEYPDPRSMAELLVKHAQQKNATRGKPKPPILVTLKDGHRPPLFLVPGGWGGLVGFLDFSRALPEGQPVLGLSFGGTSLEDRISLESVAARYAKIVRQQCPEGPFSLFGFSFGGLVVYEMAKLLGDDVSAVFILDSPGPGFRRGSGTKLANWLSKLKTYGKIAWKATPSELKEIIRRRLKRGSAVPALTLEYWLTMQYFENRDRAPYKGPVHLFRYSFQPPWVTDPNLGWSGFAPNLHVHEILGTHGSMSLQQPVIGMTAELVERVLRKDPTLL